MTNSGKVRRSWDVSPATADVLSRIQIISGVDKSELVDIAINLLFQTVLSVRKVSGQSSRDIVVAIASMFPSDERSAMMELDSTLPRFDLSQLFSLLSGDGTMTFDIDPEQNSCRIKTDSDDRRDG